MPKVTNSNIPPEVQTIRQPISHRRGGGRYHHRCQQELQRRCKQLRHQIPLRRWEKSCQILRVIGLNSKQLLEVEVALMSSSYFINPILVSLIHTFSLLKIRPTLLIFLLGNAYSQFRLQTHISYWPGGLQPIKLTSWNNILQRKQHFTQRVCHIDLT